VKTQIEQLALTDGDEFRHSHGGTTSIPSSRFGRRFRAGPTHDFNRSSGRRTFARTGISRTKLLFSPRLLSRRCRAIDFGVPKDRSNVIDQNASQRACQLTGTSSDRDSRDFGPQNVGQSKDDANSKQQL
jgi:hypothetical protein